ncbi:MAG TPA: D-alanyl-D-alanine carboxypeptidase [Epulopiscium sp.]|nr:D-alanyl-D-alanine carboxypeptidase [Candidatus Epulonipiscium sp.]
MIIRKKIVFCWLTTFLATSIIKTPANIFAEPTNVNAKGAVLVEESSMRILWEKDSDIPLPMASTTKIMTCILALEQGDLKDVVTASKRAAAAPKVKMYLKPGEKQTLGDLLHALMLQSSNDAAIAIAEHIGGSVEEFCELMTQRAKELGTHSTCFKTPNGLDLPGHMASPYDLAIITKHAYQNPEFLKIINTPSLTIPSAPLKGSQPHHLQNKNRFLNSYEGANGVKTGFTGLAGHCFVGGAKRNDMQLFAVVLGSGWGPGGSSKKYTDTIKLFEYGFSNYKMIPIKKAMDAIGTVPIIKGEEAFVTIAYGNSLEVPLTQEEEKQIFITLEIPEGITAPIRSLEPIGIAKVYIGESLVGTLPVITTSSAEKKTISRSLKKVIFQWTNLLHN